MVVGGAGFGVWRVGSVYVLHFDSEGLLIERMEIWFVVGFIVTILHFFVVCFWKGLYCFVVVFKVPCLNV